MRPTRAGILLSAIALLALAGCSDRTVGALRTVTGAAMIDPDELSTLMASGPTMSMEWVNGQSGTVNYAADGTASANVDGANSQGRWRVDGSNLCESWRDGPEACFRVHRRRGEDDAFKLFTQTGTLNAVATVQ